MKVAIVDCVPAFKNAHKHILSLFNALPKQKHLINSWKQVFGVKIHRKIEPKQSWSQWTHLEFRNREHYIEWLLRWSD